MEVILLPHKWRVWLDDETNVVKGGDTTPAKVVGYLLREDLPFDGEAWMENGAYYTGGPEMRAIETCEDLTAAVDHWEFRQKFDVTSYDIGPGPDESRQWP